MGTSGADDAVSGEYVVSDIQLAVVKSATVLDPFGGSDPVPGAEITYRIEITPSGSQTATNVVFSDAIPGNTIYSPESITLNGAAMTDEVDTDAAAFTSTPSPLISVNLGDLSDTSGVQAVEFTVTIQ